jgi:hypothetical protein
MLSLACPEHRRRVEAFLGFFSRIVIKWLMPDSRENTHRKYQDHPAE